MNFVRRISKWVGFWVRNILWKYSQQFPQYQQNVQSALIWTHWTKYKTTTYDFLIQVLAWDIRANVAELNLLNGIPPPFLTGYNVYVYAIFFIYVLPLHIRTKLHILASTQKDHILSQTCKATKTWMVP